MTVSTVILTKNEEDDLPDCLESLYWCSDIHVLDSGSEDATCEIARTQGAKVATNNFESFGQQRNWALDNLNLASEWILFLDADERSTPSFQEEITDSIKDASGSTAGFFCCWKLMLEGIWLRRSDAFPRWQMRLVRRGRARFKSVGHGQMETDVKGRLSYIKEPYLHHPFSKGWSHWLGKHENYAKLEAKERLTGTLRARDLFGTRSTARNIALKKLVVRLPFWPLLRFLHAYVWRMGILEGAPGFQYCRNIARYEAMIVRNFCNLRRQGPSRGG
ncbi:MAG: glycosyl transferase family 2 [Opitutae bacterium]|nr:glycosyl transferase family 2 [Opitutae bacterium]